MLFLLIVGSLISVSASGPMDDCLFETSNSSASLQATGQESPLYAGQIDFSVDLFKSIVNANKGQANVFLSPYSIYQALLLAYFISAGKTEENLLKTLRLPPSQTKGQTVSAYKMSTFLTSIQANGTGADFTSANKVYVASNLPMRDCVQSVFKDEYEGVDFQADHEAARKMINDWVGTTTKNQIQDFLPQGLINQQTELVLANAAYFKGLWSSQFLPEMTKKDYFYKTPDTKVNIEMMNQKKTFNFLDSKTLGAQVLEMKYKDNQIKMFVILPPYMAPNAIQTVIDRLDANTLRDILSSKSMRPREVHVSIPKFIVEQQLELVPFLSEMGIADLFSESANLTGLLKTGNVRLGSALHKAKVEVNEKGTKAAAATSLVSFRSARPLDSLVFKCNHPFVYILYDKVQDSILFYGVYYSPDA